MRGLMFAMVCGLALLAASCASTGGTGSSDRSGGITSFSSEGQPSGGSPRRVTNTRPEVVIPRASKKAVVDALAGQMSQQGYSVGRIDDYRAQFEKPGGFWLDLLAGSRFNSTAIWRVSYTLFDSPEGVRVYADMGAVTNPGSAFEKVTEVKGGKNAVAIQSILEAVKNIAANTSAQPSAADTMSRK